MRPLPKSIRDILKLAVSPPEIPGTTKTEAVEWFRNFAEGARHAYNLTGTDFKQLVVCNSVHYNDTGLDVDTLIMYLHAEDEIVVTKKFIAADAVGSRLPLTARFTNLNTKDQNFTHAQIVFLLGFEETYHAHQNKCLSHLYSDVDSKLSDEVLKNDPEARREHYAHNKIENDASDRLIAHAAYLGWCDQKYRKTAPCSPSRSFNEAIAFAHRFDQNKVKMKGPDNVTSKSSRNPNPHRN